MAYKGILALFSGMVVALGQKHGIKTPVNAMFYDNLMAIEKSYHQFSKQEHLNFDFLLLKRFLLFWTQGCYMVLPIGR